jgi:photosystem II stability/assembly factor-like uncharacterized protein
MITAADSADQQSEYIWEHSEYNLPSSNLKLSDVRFLNTTHGWVVGEDTAGVYDGVVLNTKDGGDSWNLQLSGESPYHEQIEIIDDATIWVTGEGALYHSLDGGTTWNESIVSGPSGMSFVKFINTTHGWTATSGMLYATVDGGMSWQSVSGWTFSLDVPKYMSFVTDTKVWAIGFFGIYLSEDGCITWSREFDKGGWSMSFVDESEGWAVSDSMLAHTTDGQVWSELPLPVGSPTNSPYLTDIHFINPNIGWIVGGGPTSPHVMFTPNGGLAWYEQTTPVEITERLMAIDFINETHGWAVGSDGTIIKTTNGNVLGTILVSPLSSTMIGMVIFGVITLSSAIICYIKRNRTHRLSPQNNTPLNVNFGDENGFSPE